MMKLHRGAVGIFVAVGMAAVTLLTLALLLTSAQPAQAAGEIIEFTASTYTVNEDAGTALITLTILPLSLDLLTVTVTSANGTATTPADYTAINQAIEIPIGVTEVTFTVDINNDSLFETNETLTLSLSGALIGVIGTQDTATLTILNDDAAPTVQLSNATYSIAENGGPLNATVNLSPASGVTATVNLATANGTASSASDYAARNLVVTIAPGNTSANVSVPITDDAVFEGNETFTLNLSGPTNATLGTNDSATATITDNETQPTVSLDASSYPITEGTGPITLSAELSGPSATPVTVVLSSTHNTAGASDYTPINTTLTITAGATVTSTTIAITNDSLDEPTEAFTVTLSSPNGATLAVPSSATVNIADNDPSPSVEFNAASQAVSESGGVTLTVELSAASGQNVSVPYTVGGTATAADHSLTAGSFIIPAGSTTDIVTFTVTSDGLDENDETVSATLGSPTNATLGTTTEHTVTLLDNDGPPTVSFVSSAHSVDENEGTVGISVTLSAVSGKTVNVPFTVNGSATNGVDYVFAASSITVTAGSLTGSVNLSLTNDTLDENNETMIVTLGAPSNASLGAITVQTTTITDNDNPPTVNFNPVSQSAGEADGTVPMTVTLSAASGRTVTVIFTTSGTATGGGTDYDLFSNSLVLDPGDTTGVITVTLTDDSLDEVNETAILGFDSLVNASAGASEEHTLTIVDDDAAPNVGLNAATASISEGGGAIVFTATLDAVSGRTATVDFDTSNLTALAGSDYTSTSGTLTFNPGDIAKSFSVPILDDTTYEPSETFRVTLSSASNLTINTPSQATITITNSDPAPTLQFTQAISSVLESTARYTATVRLTGSTAVTATVPYTVVAGTATAGSDYTASNGTLTFPPGTSQRNVVITITNDLSDEPDETLSIVLGTPNQATLGVNDTNTLTIQDNDGPPSLQFSASQYAFAEGSGTITLTVSLNFSAGYVISVPFSSTNGTAVAGLDYVARAGTLTFPANTTSRPLTFTLTNDAVVENNKTFNVTLSAPSPAGVTLGSPANTVVTIANDDARAGCTIYYSTDVPKNIPDNSTVGITSTLTLPMPGVIITDVSVRIEAVTHPWIGDLVVSLVAPNSQSTTLLNRNGAGANLSFTVFNDASPALSGNPPFIGNYRPNTALPALGLLNGQRTSGTWRLVVKDLAQFDTGQIQRWGLELCGTMTHQLFLPLIRR